MLLGVVALSGLVLLLRAGCALSLSPKPLSLSPKPQREESRTSQGQCPGPLGPTCWAPRHMTVRRWATALTGGLSAQSGRGVSSPSKCRLAALAGQAYIINRLLCLVTRSRSCFAFSENFAGSHPLSQHYLGHSRKEYDQARPGIHTTDGCTMDTVGHASDVACRGRFCLRRLHRLIFSAACYVPRMSHKSYVWWSSTSATCFSILASSTFRLTRELWK